MEVGAYDLHLYCDNVINHDNDYRRLFPMEYQGTSRSNAVESAKKAGWKFQKEGRHTCPYCNPNPPTKH